MVRSSNVLYVQSYISEAVYQNSRYLGTILVGAFILSTHTDTEEGKTRQVSRLPKWHLPVYTGKFTQIDLWEPNALPDLIDFLYLYNNILIFKNGNLSCYKAKC